MKAKKRHRGLTINIRVETFVCARLVYNHIRAQTRWKGQETNIQAGAEGWDGTLKICIWFSLRLLESTDEKFSRIPARDFQSSEGEIWMKKDGEIILHIMKQFKINENSPKENILDLQFRD